MPTEKEMQTVLRYSEELVELQEKIEKFKEKWEDEYPVLIYMGKPIIEFPAQVVDPELAVEATRMKHCWKKIIGMEP